MTSPAFNAAMIIPTGIGASIGGYGGDGASALQLMAHCCDTLITHPNVANAAAFQNCPNNALYVEGYGLDQFFRGKWGLSPVRKNQIGVVFDAAIEPRMLTHHINTINAVQTIYGIDVMGIVQTHKPIESQVTLDDSGASGGLLKNPETLIESCEALIAQGAEAIALCTQTPQIPVEAEKLYKEGQGVDPIGGIEAILSHLTTAHFKVPTAHAPVLSEHDAMPEMEHIVDPRAASEFIVSTFLPSVLIGLNRAPQFVSHPSPSSLWLNDLNALIIPADALGGIPTLSCLEHHIPIIAVSDNKTVMDVLPHQWNTKTIHVVENYYEAAGKLLALKNGLPLTFQPESVHLKFKQPVNPL